MNTNSLSRTLQALLAWGIAWAAMAWLYPQLDLANLAMLLILASALASLWVPSWVSMVTMRSSGLGL